MTKIERQNVIENLARQRRIQEKINNTKEQQKQSDLKTQIQEKINNTKRTVVKEKIQEKLDNAKLRIETLNKIKEAKANK